MFKLIDWININAILCSMLWKWFSIISLPNPTTFCIRSILMTYATDSYIIKIYSWTNFPQYGLLPISNLTRWDLTMPKNKMAKGERWKKKLTFSPRPTLHSFFLRLPMNRGSVSFTASCGIDLASADVWTSSCGTVIRFFFCKTMA